MFNIYTLKARLYPIVIVLFPIVVLGISYSFEFQSYIQVLSSLGIVSALTYFVSQIGRDAGKKKEKFLWNSWGGAPSVQLLRLRDTNIDSHTKTRYHRRLLTLVTDTNAIDLVMESNSPEKADEVYKAWTKFLITQTRDTKKYSLLFYENTSYGFRRNLFGLKPFAIFLTVTLLACNYFFWVIKNNSWNPITMPLSFQISSCILFCILLIWLFIITSNWVKLTAFAYAERLCESIDSI